MRVSTFLVSLLLLSHLAPAAGAESLGPGMRLPDVVLVDQHDVAGGIPPDTRLVLFTRDMDAASIVKEALAEDGPALLGAAHAVCVADIEGMPAMITNLFALPAMRKRPYRLLLDRNGTLTTAWPSMPEKVTVLRLQALVIEQVDYVDSPEALRAALGRSGEPTPLPTVPVQ